MLAHNVEGGSMRTDSDSGTDGLRELAVDLEDLELAYESHHDGTSWFLNTESGEVLMRTDEAFRELESIYEDLGEEAADSDKVKAAIEETDVPDWMRDTLLEAHDIEQHFGTKYVKVPTSESREGFRDMEDFIETIQDARFASHLEYAIRARRPFASFKDALFDDPQERERWFAFKRERNHDRLREWLESAGLRPAD